jgi:hypothetical protein
MLLTPFQGEDSAYVSDHGKLLWDSLKATLEALEHKSITKPKRSPTKDLDSDRRKRDDSSCGSSSTDGSDDESVQHKSRVGRKKKILEEQS